MEEEERKKKLLAGKEKLAAFRSKKCKKKKVHKAVAEPKTPRSDVEDDIKSTGDEVSSGDVSSSFEDSDQMSASGDESFSDVHEVECRSNLKDSKAYLKLKSEFKNCVERIAELEESLFGKQDAINELTHENELLRKQQSVHQNEESDNGKDVASNSQIVEYRVALSKRDEIIKQLTERLQSTLKSGNLSMEYGPETDLLAQQVQGLQAQLQQAGESLRIQLTQQHISAKALQDAKTEIMALQENILLRDNMVSKLNKKLSETQDAYNGLEQKYTELQLQHSDTVNMLDELNSKNSDFENLPNSHINSDDINDSTSLDTAIQQLHTGYKIQLSELNEKMERMEQEKTSVLTSKLSKVSDDYESVIGQLDEAQHLLHNYQTQVEEYECKLINLQEHVVQQDDTLVQLQKENSFLSEERTCQLQQNEELKNKINNDQSYLVNLLSELDQLKSDNRIYCEQHSKLSEMFEDQSKNLEYMEMLKDENTQLQTHNIQLQNEVLALDTQIHELKLSLQSSSVDSTSQSANLSSNIQVPTLKEIILANDKFVCDKLDKCRTLEMMVANSDLCSMENRIASLESELTFKDDYISQLKSTICELNQLEPVKTAEKQTDIFKGVLVDNSDSFSVPYSQAACVDTGLGDTGLLKIPSNGVSSAFQNDKTFQTNMNCDVSFKALIDRDMQTEDGAHNLPLLACVSEAIQTDSAEVSKCLVDTQIQTDIIVVQSEELLNDFTMHKDIEHFAKVECENIESVKHMSDLHMQTSESVPAPARSFTDVEIQTDAHCVSGMENLVDQDVQTEDLSLLKSSHEEHTQSGNISSPKSMNDASLHNSDTFSSHQVSSLIDGEVQTDYYALLKDSNDGVTQTENISSLQLFSEIGIQAKQNLNDGYMQTESHFALPEKNYSDGKSQTDDVCIMEAKPLIESMMQTDNLVSMTEVEMQTDTINTYSDGEVQTEDCGDIDVRVSDDGETQTEDISSLQHCANNEFQIDAGFLLQEKQLDSYTQIENINSLPEANFIDQQIQTEDVHIVSATKLFTDSVMQTDHRSQLMDAEMQTDTVMNMPIDDAVQTHDDKDFAVKMSEGETQMEDISSLQVCFEKEVQTDNDNIIQQKVLIDCFTQMENVVTYDSTSSVSDIEIQTEDAYTESATKILNDGVTQTDGSSLLVESDVIKDIVENTSVDGAVKTDCFVGSPPQLLDGEMQTEDVHVSVMKVLHDTESQTLQSLLVFNELQTASVLNNFMDEVVQTDPGLQVHVPAVSNGEVQTEDVCIVSPLRSYDEMHISNMNSEICDNDIAPDVFVYPDLNLTCDTYGSCNNSPDGEMSPVTETILKPVSEALVAASQQSMCAEPQQDQYVSPDMQDVEQVYTFPLMQSSAQLCALSNEVDRLQILGNKKDEEVLELQIKVVDFESRISYFKEERKNMEENILLINQEKNSLECECHQLSRMKQKLETSNASLRNEVSGLQNALESLKGGMLNAEQKFDDDKELLQNDLNYYQDRLLESANTIDKLTADNSALESMKLDFEEKLGLLQKQLDTSNESYQLVCEVNSALKNKLEDVGSLEKHITTLKNNDNMCQEITAEREAVSNELEEKAEKIEQIEHVPSMSSEKDNLLNEIDKSNVVLDLEEKYSAMHSQSDLTGDDMDRLEAEVRELKLKISDMIDDLDGKSEKISLLEEKRSNLELEKNTLVEEVSQMSDHIAIEQKLKEIVDGKVSILEEIDEKVKRITVLEEENRCIVDDLNKKEVKIVQLELEREQILASITEENIKQVDDSPSTISDTTSDSNIEEMKSQVTSFSSACDSLCVQVESFTALTSDVKMHDNSFVPLTHVESKEETITGIYEQELNNSFESSPLPKEISKSHDIVKYIHGLKLSRNENYLKFKKIEKDNICLQASIEKLTIEIADHKTSYCLLQKASDEEKLTTVSLMEDIQQKDLELQELNNVIQCLKDESAMFSSKINGLLLQLADYSDKNNNILADCEQKQSNIDKLSAEISHYQNSLQNYKSQVDVLQASVEEAEKKLIHMASHMSFALRDNEILRNTNENIMQEKDFQLAEICSLKDSTHRMENLLHETQRDRDQLQTQLDDHLSRENDHRIIPGINGDFTVSEMLEENEKMKQQLKMNQITFERNTSELNKKWYDELADVSQVNLELKDKLGKFQENEIEQSNHPAESTGQHKSIFSDISNGIDDTNKLQILLSEEREKFSNLSEENKILKDKCEKLTIHLEELVMEKDKLKCTLIVAADNMFDTLSFFLNRLNTSCVELGLHQASEGNLDCCSSETSHKTLEDLLVTLQQSCSTSHVKDNTLDRMVELSTLIGKMVTYSSNLKNINKDLEQTLSDLNIKVSATTDNCDRLEKENSTLQLKVKKVLSLLQKEREKFGEEKNELTFECNKVSLKQQELFSINEQLEADKLQLEIKISDVTIEKDQIEKGRHECVAKVEEVLYSIDNGITPDSYEDMQSLDRVIHTCKCIKQNYHAKCVESEELRIDNEKLRSSYDKCDTQINILSAHIDKLNTENARLAQDLYQQQNINNNIAKIDRKSGKKLAELSEAVLTQIKSYRSDDKNELRHPSELTVPCNDHKFASALIQGTSVTDESELLIENSKTAHNDHLTNFKSDFTKIKNSPPITSCLLESADLSISNSTNATKFSETEKVRLNEYIQGQLCLVSEMSKDIMQQLDTVSREKEELLVRTNELEEQIKILENTNNSFEMTVSNNVHEVNQLTQEKHQIGQRISNLERDYSDLINSHESLLSHSNELKKANSHMCQEILKLMSSTSNLKKRMKVTQELDDCELCDLNTHGLCELVPILKLEIDEISSLVLEMLKEKEQITSSIESLSLQVGEMCDVLACKHIMHFTDLNEKMNVPTNMCHPDALKDISFKLNKILSAVQELTSMKDEETSKVDDLSGCLSRTEEKVKSLGTALSQKDDQIDVLKNLIKETEKISADQIVQINLLSAKVNESEVNKVHLTSSIQCLKNNYHKKMSDLSSENKELQVTVRDLDDNLKQLKMECKTLEENNNSLEDRIVSLSESKAKSCVEYKEHLERLEEEKGFLLNRISGLESSLQDVKSELSAECDKRFLHEMKTEKKNDRLYAEIDFEKIEESIKELDTVLNQIRNDQKSSDSLSAQNNLSSPVIAVKRYLENLKFVSTHSNIPDLKDEYDATNTETSDDDFCDCEDMVDSAHHLDRGYSQQTVEPFLVTGEIIEEVVVPSHQSSNMAENIHSNFALTGVPHSTECLKKTEVEIDIDRTTTTENLLKELHSETSKTHISEDSFSKDNVEKKRGQAESTANEICIDAMTLPVEDNVLHTTNKEQSEQVFNFTSNLENTKGNLKEVNAAVQILGSELTKYREKNSELATCLDQETLRNKSLRKQNEELLENDEEWKKELDNQIILFQELEEKYSRLLSEYDGDQAYKSELSSERDSYKLERDHLIDKVSSLEEKQVKVTDEIVHVKHFLQELKTEKQQLLQKLADTEAVIEECQNITIEKESLVDRVEDIKCQLLETTAREKNCIGQIVELKEGIQHLMSEKQKLTTENYDIQCKLEEIQHEKNEILEAKIKLDADVESYIEKYKASQCEIIKLTESHEEQKLMAEHNCEKLENVQDENTHLIRSNEYYTIEIKELKDSLTSTEARFTKSLEDKDLLCQELKKKLILEEENYQKIEMALRNSEELHRDQITQLKNRYLQTEKELEDVHCEKKKHIADVSRFKEALSVESVNKERILYLEEQLQHTVSSTQFLNEQHASDLCHQQHQITILQEELRSIQQKLFSSLSSVATTNCEFQQLDRHLSSVQLNPDKSTSSDRTTKTAFPSVNLQEKIKEIINDKSYLESQLEDSEKQLNDLRNEYKDKSSQLESQIMFWTDKYNSLSTTLETENDTFQSTLSDHETEIKRLQELLFLHEQNIDLLKSERDSSFAACKMMQKVLNTIEAEIMRLEKATGGNHPPSVQTADSEEPKPMETTERAGSETKAVVKGTETCSEYREDSEHMILTENNELNDQVSNIQERLKKIYDSVQIGIDEKATLSCGLSSALQRSEEQFSEVEVVKTIISEQCQRLVCEKYFLESTLNTLQGNVYEKQLSNQHLINRIDSLEIEKTELASSLLTSTKQLESDRLVFTDGRNKLQEHILSLENEIQELEKDKRVDAERYESKVEELESRLQQVEQKLEQMQISKDNKESAIDLLEADCKNKSTTIAHLQKCLTKTEEEYGELENKMRLMFGEIDQSKQQVEETSSDHQKLMEQLTELSSTNNNLKSELSTLKTNSTAIIDLENVNKQLQEDLNIKKSAYEELMTEHETLKNDFCDAISNNDNIKSELHDVKTVHANNIHLLEDQIKVLEQELLNNKNTSECLIAEHDACKDAAVKELRDMQNKLNYLEQYHDEQMESVMNENRKLESDYSTIKEIKQKDDHLHETTVKQLEASLEEVKGEKEDLIQVLTAVDDQIEKQTTEHAVMIEQLHQQLANASENTMKLEESVLHLKEQLNDQKVEHDSTVQQLEINLSDLQHDKAELKKQYSLTVDKLNESAIELESHKNSVDQLTSERDNLEDSFYISKDVLEKEKSELEAQMKSLTRQLNESHVNIESLNEKENTLTQCQNQVCKLEKQVEDLMDKNAELRATITSLQHEVNRQEDSALIYKKKSEKLIEKSVVTENESERNILCVDETVVPFPPPQNKQTDNGNSNSDGEKDLSEKPIIKSVQETLSNEKIDATVSDYPLAMSGKTNTDYTKLTDQDKEISHLQQQVIILEMKVQEVGDHNRELKDSIAALEDELVRTKESSVKAKWEMEHVVDELRERLDESVNQCNDIKHELEANAEREEQVKHQLQETNQSNIELGELVSDLQNQIQIYKNQLEQNRLHQQSLLHNLRCQEESSPSTCSLKNNKELLDQCVGDMNMEQSVEMQFFTENTNQNDSSEVSLIEMKKIFDRLLSMKHVLHVENEQLNNSLTDTQAELERTKVTLETKICEISDEKSALETDFDELNIIMRNEKGDFQNQTSAFKNKIEKLSHENAQLTEKMKAMVKTDKNQSGNGDDDVMSMPINETDIPRSLNQILYHLKESNSSSTYFCEPSDSLEENSVKTETTSVEEIADKDRLLKQQLEVSKQLEAKYVAMREIAEGRKKEAVIYRERMLQLNSELSQVKDDMTNMVKQHEKEMNEVLSMKSSLISDSVKRKYETEICSLQDKVETLRSDVRSLHGSRNQLVGNLQASQEENKRQSTDLDTLKHMYSELLSHVKDTTVDDGIPVTFTSSNDSGVQTDILQNFSLFHKSHDDKSKDVASSNSVSSHCEIFSQLEVDTENQDMYVDNNTTAEINDSSKQYTKEDAHVCQNKPACFSETAEIDTSNLPQKLLCFSESAEIELPKHILTQLSHIQNQNELDNLQDSNTGKNDIDESPFPNLSGSSDSIEASQLSNFSNPEICMHNNQEISMASPELSNILDKLKVSYEKEMKQKEYEMEENHARRLRSLEVEITSRCESQRLKELEEMKAKHKRDIEAVKMKKQEEFIQAFQKMKKDMDLKYGLKKGRAESHDEGDGGPAEASSGQLGEEVKRLHKDNQELAEARDALLQQLSHTEEFTSDSGIFDSVFLTDELPLVSEEKSFLKIVSSQLHSAPRGPCEGEFIQEESFEQSDKEDDELSNTDVPVLNSAHSHGIFVREQSCDESFVPEQTSDLTMAEDLSHNNNIQETSLEQSDKEDEQSNTGVTVLNSPPSHGIFVREESCDDSFESCDESFVPEDTSDLSTADDISHNNNIQQQIHITNQLQTSLSDPKYPANQSGIFVEECSDGSPRPLNEIALPVEEEIVEETFIPEYSLDSEMHPLENDVHKALEDESTESKETNKMGENLGMEINVLDTAETSSPSGNETCSEKESHSIATDAEQLRNLCRELRSKINYYKTSNEYLEQKFTEEHKKFIQEKLELCTRIKLLENTNATKESLDSSSEMTAQDLQGNLNYPQTNIVCDLNSHDSDIHSNEAQYSEGNLLEVKQINNSETDQKVKHLEHLVEERDAFLKILIDLTENLKIKIEEHKLREAFYKAKCESTLNPAIQANSESYAESIVPTVESWKCASDDISDISFHDSNISNPRFNSTEIENARSVRSSVSSGNDSLEDFMKIRRNLDPEDDGHLALELKHFEIVGEVTRLRHDLRVTKAIYVRENALLLEALNRESFAREMQLQSPSFSTSDSQFILPRNMIELRQKVAILTEENKSLRIENDRWLRRIQEQECLVIRLRELLGRNSPDILKVESAFKRQVLLLQNQREELLEKLKKRDQDGDNLSSVLCEKDLLAETLRREKLLLAQKLQEKHTIESELFERKLEFEKLACKQQRLEEIIYEKDQTEKQLMKQKRLLEMELSEIESKLEEREAELVEEKNELLNELKEKDSTIQRLAVSQSSDLALDETLETTSMIALPVSQNFTAESTEIPKPLKKAKLRHSSAIRALRSRLSFGSRDKKKLEKYSSDSSLQN